MSTNTEIKRVSPSFIENDQRISLMVKLIDIDYRASRGKMFNGKLAEQLANSINQTWTLGPIGRLKSGAYWVAKGVFYCSESLRRIIDVKKATSVIHSALAHCSQANITEARQLLEKRKTEEEKIPITDLVFRKLAKDLADEAVLRQKKS